MFVETGKKFIESFSETKTQTSLVVVMQQEALWATYLTRP